MQTSQNYRLSSVLHKGEVNGEAINGKGGSFHNQ
jgi:hypothetical protein